MDLIGIDVNFAVTESVYAAFFDEPRYRPHPIQRRMVESGMIGRKTGRGFYVYGGAVPVPNPLLTADASYAGALTRDRLPADLDRALVAGLVGAGAGAESGRRAPGRLRGGSVVCALGNEAAFALGEGVASATDIDTAMTPRRELPAWPARLGRPPGPAARRRTRSTTCATSTARSVIASPPCSAA